MAATRSLLDIRFGLAFEAVELLDVSVEFAGVLSNKGVALSFLGSDLSKR